MAAHGKILQSICNSSTPHVVAGAGGIGVFIFKSLQSRILSHQIAAGILWYLFIIFYFIFGSFHIKTQGTS